MCRPRFTSVQQFADNTGVVHCYLRLDGEFGILPHSRGEANECGCCFSNPLAYLSVQGEVAADSGPHVCDLRLRTSSYGLNNSLNS